MPSFLHQADGYQVCWKDNGRKYEFSPDSGSPPQRDILGLRVAATSPQIETPETSQKPMVMLINSRGIAIRHFSRKGYWVSSGG